MRSLRGRLTLGMTLLLAAVLAVSGGLVARYVDHSERQALDARLKGTVELSRETAVAAFEQSLPSADPRLDAVLAASGTSLRLLLGKTLLLHAGTPLPAGAPTPRPGLRTFSAAGARYRSYTVTLRDAGLGGLARLQVATSLRSLEQRQATLHRTLAAFGLAALVVLAVGVWLASDLLLAPLRRLRAVTSTIAGAEDLDRRVPPDDGPAELRSLAASFNGMLARLGRSAEDRQRALAATRRFTADVGHELRTPLTSVQATLSALSRHPTMEPERRAELVGSALTEHRRLVDLLDGLQAIARGDSAPVAHTEVDLAELAALALDDAAARHPDVTWSSELPDGPLIVRGWEPGLRSLVDNLLENAARHGRPGGSVRLTLAPGPAVHVDDDGPGVPAAQRKRIFEPFVRLDGTTAPGSGLGLALVLQQAHAHGATIAVADSPLGGARFSLRFAAPASAAG